MEKGKAKAKKENKLEAIKTDEVGSPLLPQTKELMEQKLSQDRLEALTKNVFGAINETSKQVEGDFTIYEIMDALLRVGHSYNKRFLDNQNKPQVDESKR